jgi:hypothetical protein
MLKGGRLLILSGICSLVDRALCGLLGVLFLMGSYQAVIFYRLGDSDDLL